MTTFIVRRILQLVFVLWGAVTLMFLLFFLLPDDPARLLAGGSERAVDEQVIQNVRARYGLDKPIPVQYAKYLNGIVTFDFGQSYRDDRPVVDIIKERAPTSLRIAFWAMTIEATLGIGLGVLAAVRKYSIADAATTIGAALFSAIPVFVLAYLLTQFTGVYSFQHGWPAWARLPVQGMGPNKWILGVVPSASQVQYLVQPAIVLASVSTVVVARLARTTMLEVSNADFIRTARAKGLRERDITIRHGLRNAMIPVITFIGIDFGTLVGSAILTETVFNLQGLGSKIAAAADGRDLPVLIGCTFTVVLVYGIINLLVDISYAWFDPRVRLGSMV
jgi:ABC-type dipeptide/oligopeptide/nickel transport system permease component